MNRHGDHDATCYCCKNVYMEYEGDWSELTPGEGFEFGCHKKHFHYGDENLDMSRDFSHIIHKVMTLAQECRDFTGREE